ncbi:MAG: acetyltransferase [Pseudomonadota bacterium]
MGTDRPTALQPDDHASLETHNAHPQHAQPATFTTDVRGNRAAIKWSKRELLGRLLWDLAHPLFAYSPRPLWGWRRFLLRAFGAKIGAGFRVHPSVRVHVPWNLRCGDHVGIGDGAILYALGPIEIGDGATVSQGAHLCAGTHDHTDPALPLIKSTIRIGDHAWVCADAFVGPDVTVGNAAIVGARGVAMRDVEAGVIVAGNPAKPIKKRTSR